MFVELLTKMVGEAHSKLEAMPESQKVEMEGMLQKYAMQLCLDITPHIKDQIPNIYIDLIRIIGASQAKPS